MASSYLNKVLNRAERKLVIATAVRKLRKFKDKFDAIAVTGSSGLLIGPAVADKLDKDLILVRKDKDNSHSCLSIEYDGISQPNMRYIILDDIVASGDTIRAIHRKMNENFFDVKFDYVGLYLYNQNSESFSYRRDKLAFHMREHITIAAGKE